MAIEFTRENLEGVEEAFKPLYKEAEGGGFVLDVSGVVPKSQYDAISQKMVDATTEAARRRKTVERVTQKLGIESADKLDDAIDALLTGKKSNPEHEQVIAQLRTSAAAREKELTDAILGLKMDNAKSAFAAELAKVKFPAKAAEMFATANMNRLQLDADGKLRIMSTNGTPLSGSGADGFATLADLANELAAAMPEFLVDTGKGGAGKPPASGGAAAGTKSITRAQYDAMSIQERPGFFKSGGVVID